MYAQEVGWSIPISPGTLDVLVIGREKVRYRRIL
jgi:hypothetical protein